MSNEEENMAAPDESVPGILTDKVTELVCSECACKIDVSGVETFSKVECPDCRGVETVPARLGHFLLLTLIGKGGMGGVYYAKDESLGRFVAIKVILESMGHDREFVDTFKREAQSVAQLNHPNIAQIYSFGMEKGQPYIVMELVSGQRFDKMIASGETLDQGLVMKIGLDIAEALSAADEIGLVHGDIKPENILLDEKWRAKLVDFGLARFAGQAVDDGVWGTPFYIAPEKVRRQKVDSRADMYSLGATLYHALANRPPFDGDTPIDVVKARLNREAPPLHFWRKDVNDEVENIVMRMMQEQPAKRYPNYNSLISDMRNVVRDLGADRKNYTVNVEKRAVKLLVSKAKKAGGAAGIGASRASRNIGETSAIRAKKRTNALIVTAGTTSEAGGEALRDDLDMEIDESALEERRRRQLAAAKQAREARARRSRIVLWVLLLVILAAAGGGLANHLKQKRTREEQVRKELLALQAQIKLADDTYAKLSVPVTNILAMEITARTHIEKANQLAGEAEIKAAADKVVTEAGKVLERAQKARTTSANALTLKNGTVKTTFFESARDGVQRLSGFLAVMRQAEDESRLALAASEQTLNETIALKTKMDAEEKEALARAAKEKLEQQKKQQEEQHSAQIQSELQMAEQAKNNAVVFLAQNKYKEGASDLDVQLASYRTEEGRAAIKLLAEKYKRLQDLKLFVIARLAADGYPWGYSKGTFSVDVLGADDKSVKITGEQVPWITISPQQMKKFIDRALATGRLPAKTLAEYYLAAAIFCELNNMGKSVSAYTDNAARLDAELKPEIKRLAPSAE